MIPAMGAVSMLARVVLTLPVYQAHAALVHAHLPKNVVVATVGVGHNPNYLALAPNNKFVYVPNTGLEHGFGD
jgi:DNA-binding beta-propeller fold protein YncE